MKDRRRFTLFVLLCVVVLIIGLLGYCNLSPKEQFAFDCVSRKLPENGKASNGLFLDNQIIITGPRIQVNEIAESHQLSLVQDCDLRYLGTLAPPPEVTALAVSDDKRSADSVFTDAQLDRDADTNDNYLVMRLYETNGNSPLEDVIYDINKVGNGDPEKSLFVFADPNYLTDALQGNGSCGNPYSGGGSPYSGGGSSYATPGIPATDVSQEFINQWALSQQGVSLPVPGSTTGNSVPLQGEGVQVAIFDTVPEASPFNGLAGNTEKEVRFSLPSTLARPFNLTVLASDAILVPLLPITPPINNMNDHGLFVAGLIHAIAPASTIHLIRVLNNDGCGDLMTISSAIHTFTSRMSTRGPNPRLDKVVINLSLGVHQPDFSHMPEELKDKVRTDLVALRQAIFEAHNRGAIIVAASGNDSANVVDAAGAPQAEGMQLPADYDKVLGVAASNATGVRSCYSNKGDVAAPGGDGGPGKNPDGTANPCVARAGTWDSPTELNSCSTTAGMGQCGYGLISLSQTVTGGPGFIYWTGTSFSAPLVTGLAAQALERTGGNRRNAVCLVLGGATDSPSATGLGSGIVNISNSFSAAVTAQCGVGPIE